jgi:hypothetical protein
MRSVLRKSLNLPGVKRPVVLGGIEPTGRAVVLAVEKAVFLGDLYRQPLLDKGNSNCHPAGPASDD